MEGPFTLGVLNSNISVEHYFLLYENEHTFHSVCKALIGFWLKYLLHNVH
jgi:hypothetical protein